MINGIEVSVEYSEKATVTFDLTYTGDSYCQGSERWGCGWPVYDRRLHNPVDDAITIDGGVVLLEGNYLLLDEDGWRDLRRYADDTISIGADEEMLRGRLINRKVKTGVDREEAIRFVNFSHMPNVQLCLKMTMCSNLMLYTDGKDYTKVISEGGQRP